MTLPWPISQDLCISPFIVQITVVIKIVTHYIPLQHATELNYIRKERECFT